MAQNANNEQGSKEQGTAQVQAASGLAALVAQSVAQGAQAAQKGTARTKKNGYGVFTLVPEGLVVRVMYDEDGRELAQWQLVGDVNARGAVTLAATFSTKRAALAWVDSLNAGGDAEKVRTAMRAQAAQKK